MTNSEILRFYISCPPGLEPMLAAEYKTIGLSRVKLKKDEDNQVIHTIGEDTGGMEFEGPLEHVYLANLHLRTASRVTVRLGEFKAITFAELRKKSSKMEWSRYLIPGQKVSIQVTCHKSRLYHSDAVAERILGSIDDYFSASSKKTELSTEGQIVLVRLVNDNCTISLDSSGDLLHKRGYRQAVAKAPLRENLSAGIIMASGWDKVAPLIDPFCGSGTIPIEAAMMAQHIAPGINRSFKFTNWPAYNKLTWIQILDEAKKQIIKESPPIFGYDRDAGAIEMSKANAARAGQKDQIQFFCQAVSLLESSSSTGWIITNPPYGIRVSENKDLRDLYARFGAILKQNFSSWHVSVLCNDDQLIANLGLQKPEKTIRLINGGISVKQGNYFL
ncbi:MAG: class I SAM-dependent RNA methyltransferase [Chloroflexi bacterium HGW-Chloroflexi-4]|jgi:putative N6-adenine-specific DNA methylase|nr:MAG: class I SAM-dependent RNA methyltransferase [Chloroflexi bacterium HGW-Chloroflexi-4]